MSLTSANLVGYMRAEFKKAALLRNWLFGLQLAAALPTSTSVLIPDADKIGLYVLAILGAILLAAWCIVNSFYLRTKSAANAARRGALLLGGLPDQLSTSEIQSLRDRFTVDAEEARQCEDPQYYASVASPSSTRLAEMLEESAIYSQELHRLSAIVMFAILILFVLIALAVAIGTIPFATRGTGFLLVRIFLSALMFVFSSDVLGAWQAHLSATKDIGRIRQRLMTADHVGYPMSDVLLAMTDYNAAIEGAPEVVPFIYPARRKKLDQRWKDYQSDRARSRANRP